MTTSSVSSTVVFVAPQGSGKTRAAQSLCAHYGCADVVEEWFEGQPVRPGALHLCHSALSEAPASARLVAGVEAANALRAIGQNSPQL